MKAYAQAHRRGSPKRAPLPADLPRVDIEHRLEEWQRTCPHHGVELERFGEVVSEQLDSIPAQARVLRHVRGKYRCPICEGHLRTAAMPAQPLAKSFASPGLLAFIATAKYADALPLYRQCQQLQRIGVGLSRTTLARWMVGMGELVVPLINVLRARLCLLRHVFTELPKAHSLVEIEALLPTWIGPGDLAGDSLQGSFPTARQ